MRRQKKRSIDATSTVPPLLLATMNSVSSGSELDAACVIVRSSVVSRTVRRGYPSATPNTAAMTSAHKLLPPIPSR